EEEVVTRKIFVFVRRIGFDVAEDLANGDVVRDIIRGDVLQVEVVGRRALEFVGVYLREARRDTKVIFVIDISYDGGGIPEEQRGRSRRQVHLANAVDERAAIAEHQLVSELIRGLHQDLKPRGGRVLVRQILTVVDVLDEAVALDSIEGGTHRQPVRDQRQVHRAFLGVVIVVAVAAGEGAVEIERRRLGDDAKRAAGGVAAEQGALRAPQQLDPAEVIEVQAAQQQREFVEIDLDSGLAPVGLLRLAAHGEHHPRGVTLVLYGQRRREVG